jgi:hypothetical protein
VQLLLLLPVQLERHISTDHSHCTAVVQLLLLPVQLARHISTDHSHCTVVQLLLPPLQLSRHISSTNNRCLLSSVFPLLAIRQNSLHGR